MPKTPLAGPGGWDLKEWGRLERARQRRRVVRRALDDLARLLAVSVGVRHASSGRLLARDSVTVLVQARGPDSDSASLDSSTARACVLWTFVQLHFRDAVAFYVPITSAWTTITSPGPGTCRGPAP